MDSNGKFQSGRKRQREIVIAQLLTKPTIREVAVECNISVSTIQRWLRDPTFVAEMNATKTEMTNGITAQLRAAAPRAVETLAAISDNPVAPEPSRVAAASRIVEFFNKASTLESIEARLAQLESGTE